MAIRDDQGVAADEEYKDDDFDEVQDGIEVEKQDNE